MPTMLLEIFLQLVKSTVFYKFPFLILILFNSNFVLANMPDYYSEPGLNPFRDYNSQQGYENVDPFTGKLQLNHVDIIIPGNGGFDLKVSRSYASGNYGGSWSMHLGYVYKNISSASPASSLCYYGTQISNKLNPVLVLQDGSAQVLSDSDNSGQYLFISSQHWKAKCAPNANGLIVTSPEGTVYEMTYAASNQSQIVYYVQKITDRNGNTISINYINPNSNGAKISSITTSDGRSLNYTYTTDGSYVVLSSITDGSRTWQYTHVKQMSGGQVVSGAYQLTQVTRPDGLTWQYGYKANSTGYGSNAINYLKNPSGGTINYTYGSASFYFAGAGTSPDHVITSKTLTGLGTWTYAYLPSSGQGVFDTTTVTEPSRTLTYKHFGYNTVASVGESWKIGLLQSKAVGTTQTEAYVWSPLLVSQHNNARIFSWVTKVDNEFYAPILASKTISRDGSNFVLTNSGFDAWGNPSTVTETGSATRTLTRTYYVDTAKWILKRLKSETNGTFNLTYGFDTNGNITSENKYGVVTQFGRTANGDVSSVTDARGKIKTLSSYYRGIPQSETLPDGAVFTRVVSSAGNIISEKNGVNATATYTYNGINQLTSITNPVGNAVSVAWTATTRALTRGNFRQTITYDSFFRPTSIARKDLTTNVTIITTLTNDALGRKTFESLPGSATGTTYAYDAINRKKTVAFANNTTNTYTYSGSNIAFKNEKDANYTYGYRIYSDPDDKQLLSIVAPIVANNMTITRNAIGQPLSIAQNGATRSYGYAANAFLTSETHPETGVTTHGRDAVGNMTTRKVGASGVTTYTYDPMNRVSTITYPVPASTPNVTFVYDKVGQVLTASSGAIFRTNTYDANKNLTSEKLDVDGLSYQAVYAYNANDVLNKITYPSGQIITYSLDAFGRQTAATPYASNVVYHPSGQPSSIALANGVVTTYNYQARYWPSTMSISKTTTSLTNQTYTYDNNGNITNIADTVLPDYNRALSFDATDRLSGANGLWGTGTIAYNGQGNITSQQYGTYVLTHNYDTQNRLSTVTGSKPYTITYDVYGNITNNGISSFQYDDASNMRCTNCSLTSKVNYDYDANNLRSKKLTGTTNTYYLYSINSNLLGEYTPDTQNTKEYFYLGQKLLTQSETTGANPANMTYYHPDIVGSPILATDSNGILKWREHYWPYGERNLRDTNASTETRWFTGKPQDTDTGLSYFGARYYDPLLGRFMGIDPAGVDENNIHSHNRYAYGNNNPYRFVDPDGNAPVCANGYCMTEGSESGGSGMMAFPFGGGGIGSTLLGSESAASINGPILPIVGIVGVAKTAQVAEKDAIKRINAQSIKEFKALVRDLSKPNSKKLSTDELKQFEKLTESFGGKLRQDLNPVNSKHLGPHVQVEGLGSRVESRHIQLEKDVK